MRRSPLALAALATAAVPGMRPVRVAEVHPSADRDDPPYQVALLEDVTGRRWVVHAPMTPAAGAELEQGDALVRQLGKHLPWKVPVAAGYASLGAGGRAVVYPHVEGSPLNLRNLPAGPGLAAAVGRAIAAVHNMPPGLYEECGVPVFDTAAHRARKLAELDRAAETGQVPTGLLARWEQALEAMPLWQFATTPTHGNLDGDCFVVVFSDDDDAASGRVVAVTGWQRAQLADPADDFAAIVREASPAAFDSVLDSYALARNQRPDAHLAQRARLAAEMRLLTGLAAAVAADDEQMVRGRADALRRLDRLTSADDSLLPRTARPSPGVALPAVAPTTAATEDPATKGRMTEDPATEEPAGGSPPSGPTDNGAGDRGEQTVELGPVPTDETGAEPLQDPEHHHHVVDGGPEDSRAEVDSR